MATKNMQQQVYRDVNMQQINHKRQQAEMARMKDLN